MHLLKSMALWFVGMMQVPLQVPRLICLFLPQPHKPASVPELAASGASEGKCKTVLFPETPISDAETTNSVATSDPHLPSKVRLLPAPV